MRTLSTPTGRSLPFGLGNHPGRTGVVGLFIAGVVVAVAISLDGPASRGVNGLGAIVWLASAALVAIAVHRLPRGRVSLIVAAVVALGLSLTVDVETAWIAIVAFGVAGAAVGLVGSRSLVRAVAVPALWLPIHLLTAVVPAIIAGGGDGESSIRTDAPPTAALVPLLMVVGAALGGQIAGRVRTWWAARG